VTTNCATRLLRHEAADDGLEAVAGGHVAAHELIQSGGCVQKHQPACPAQVVDVHAGRLQAPPKDVAVRLRGDYDRRVTARQARSEKPHDCCHEDLFRLVELHEMGGRLGAAPHSPCRRIDRYADRSRRCSGHAHVPLNTSRSLGSISSRARFKTLDAPDS
jgi:hypothetical protein